MPRNSPRCAPNLPSSKPQLVNSLSSFPHLHHYLRRSGFRLLNHLGLPLITCHFNPFSELRQKLLEDLNRHPILLLELWPLPFQRNILQKKAESNPVPEENFLTSGKNR